MKLDQVRPVFDAEGPFTTVRCDVSRHTEHSAHDIQVRWESLVKELDAEGAPPGDVAAAEDRVLAETHTSGAWERTVVVCGGEVLMDDRHGPARIDARLLEDGQRTHVEVDKADHDLRDGRDDATSARGADRSPRLTTAREHDRAHVGQRTGTRTDAVGSTRPGIEPRHRRVEQ